ncbi:LacI family DNA-binding transcriptional regulator [Pedobacter hiemivivus]|uniref:LacI family DNA-binding transcriptional regulator n=1 Tax=Pedobacter hiemivivus TaxID=2530454 RepID=A0A4U1GPN9_9SPHI|nr:LacI family DNA-binding transcriptional regulator [Pedobacter hiemivivus]TKC63732.1 LacI family DNA-binding transcriptional regulator [Pedobacter hiemivivus]
MKTNMQTGVKEIARRANVSIGTVDRVLHNRTGVSNTTKNKILAIMKDLDYQPNILARRLASKKVLRFASLIPAVSKETEFWDAPIKGIEMAEAEIKQFGIVIDKYFYDQNDKQSFVNQTKNILKAEVDGILVAPIFIEESLAFAKLCNLKKIPQVFINSDIPNESRLSYIGPDLFQSGHLSAHMVNYLVKEGDKILIVNISKEIDSYHHLSRKEEGFRAYFKAHEKQVRIVKTDITPDTDYLSVAKRLTEVLSEHTDVKAIFVTNSRVFSVAQFLEKTNQEHVFLVGYDFLPQSIEHLKKGVIDFLICQKPQEQGYKGIMALYQNLVLNGEIEPTYYMPIDIITKENYKSYRN